MPEPLDLYADTYQVSTNAYAGTLNFMLSDAMPSAPGTPPRSTRVASIRLSLENIKLLTFLLHRQIRQHEEQLGVNIQIPRQVLNTLQIGIEDWQTLWGHG